jgi:hypothetical protein
MLRRYLIAFVGYVVGMGVVIVADLALGLLPNLLLAAACGFVVAGFLMAKGESLGLVKPPEEIDRPTTLFSDEKGRRR